MKRYGLLVTVLWVMLASTTAEAASFLTPTGFDAAFGGESAFLTLHRGDTGQFQVFFVNTGTIAWSKATSSEVVLSVCVDTPPPQLFRCNVLSPYADWALNWTTPRIYAATTQAVVASGSLGTFPYSVKVPIDAALGDYYFRGELAHRATGTPVHPVGYFQLVTVIP